MIKRSIANTLLAAAFFTAQAVASQKDAQKSSLDAPPGVDIPTAMQSLFGNYDPKTDSSRYSIPQSTVYNLKGSSFKIGDDILVYPLCVTGAKALMIGLILSA